MTDDSGGRAAESELLGQLTLHNWISDPQYFVPPNVKVTTKVFMDHLYPINYTTLIVGNIFVPYHHQVPQITSVLLCQN
jgi:hypothetical protein